MMAYANKAFLTTEKFMKIVVIFNCLVCIDISCHFKLIDMMFSLKLIPIFYLFLINKYF